MCVLAQRLRSKAVEMLLLIELEHAEDAVVLEHRVEVAALDRPHQVRKLKAGRELLIKPLDQRPLVAAFVFARSDEPRGCWNHACLECLHDQRKGAPLAFPGHCFVAYGPDGGSALSLLAARAAAGGRAVEADPARATHCRGLDRRAARRARAGGREAVPAARPRPRLRRLHP